MVGDQTFGSDKQYYIQKHLGVELSSKIPKEFLLNLWTRKHNVLYVQIFF